MQTYFIAVLNDKELITRDSIEELASIPFINMYFKKELHKEITNNFGNKEYYFKYTAIDREGKKQVIEIGNFKITDISPDNINKVIINDKTTYPIGRDIIIHDTINNINHKFRSNTQYDDFIIKDLLFLITSLSKIQDWEIFTYITKIPFLESELNYLKEKIRVQKEEIKLLKQK